VHACVYAFLRMYTCKCACECASVLVCMCACAKEYECICVYAFERKIKHTFIDVCSVQVTPLSLSVLWGGYD